MPNLFGISGSASDMPKVPVPEYRLVALNCDHMHPLYKVQLRRGRRTRTRSRAGGWAKPNSGAGHRYPSTDLWRPTHNGRCRPTYSLSRRLSFVGSSPQRPSQLGRQPPTLVALQDACVRRTPLLWPRREAADPSLTTYSSPASGVATESRRTSGIIVRSISRLRSFSSAARPEKSDLPLAGRSETCKSAAA